MFQFCACNVAAEALNTGLLCKGGSNVCSMLGDSKGYDAFGPYWAILLLTLSAARKRWSHQGGKCNVIEKNQVNVKMNMFLINNYEPATGCAFKLQKHDLPAGWAHNCRMHALS